MGMQNGVVTVENSLEIPQKKIKTGTIIWSSNPTCGYLSKDLKSVSQKDISTPLFFTVLFTITMIWT